MHHPVPERGGADQPGLALVNRERAVGTGTVGLAGKFLVQQEQLAFEIEDEAGNAGLESFATGGGMSRNTRLWVSDLVFGFRLDPRHDLLEFIGQVGTGLQASVHVAGQVGDAVGTRQAKPGGEFAERVFAVAAAEPGSDGASDVGISAMGHCRSVQAIVFRHRTEDGFDIASGKKSQRKVKPEGNRPARRSVTCRGVIDPTTPGRF